MKRNRGAIRLLLLASAIWATAGMAASAASTGLVGFWNFDDNVLDQSASGNNGILNGATYSADVPGAIGGGKSLDFGASGDGNNVSILANASLDSGVFTLSMFINDRGQAAGINRLISRAGDSFEVGLNKVFAPQDGQLAFFPGGWNVTSAIPTPNAWQHVALVSDGTTMNVFVGGTSIFTGPFTATPNGNMRIGSRENGPDEGFGGLIDDVGLWNTALSAADIGIIASNGIQGFLDGVEPPPPPTLVVSSSDVWSLSTVSEDGGPADVWVPSGNPPPGAETFTLTTPVIDPARTNITAAAASLGVDSIGAVNDVRFYRTTFNLDPFISATADLQIAVDNGAQVYLNGELVASETSFSAANWVAPLPSLTIGEDGTISDVNKFDDAAVGIAGLLAGENELILAIRNPNSEDPAIAGGFAFKMEVFATPIPEPSALLLSLIAMVGFAGCRRRRFIPR